MAPAVTLSEAADLAGIGTGVAALALSIVLGLQAYNQHRSSTRLQLSNELTDVLTDLSKITSGLYIGDESVRANYFLQHGMALRYLAFRADRLLEELPASDLNSFELGLIAQAFFLNSENEKAEDYFERAFAVAFAEPCADRSATVPVRLSLLRLRAECSFALSRVPEGRELYERALQLNRATPEAPDVTAESDIYTLVLWSNGEYGLANTDAAEQLLQQAEALVLTLQIPWRRLRQHAELAKVRQYRAGTVQGRPSPPRGAEDLAPR